jgi:hypothetical protein
LSPTAEQLATYTYTVDSGWKTTPTASYTLGPNSYKWIAKVTFTVAGPNPVVLIVTDRNMVSELLILTDSTGSTVGMLLAGRWSAG